MIKYKNPWIERRHLKLFRVYLHEFLMARHKSKYVQVDDSGEEYCDLDLLDKLYLDLVCEFEDLESIRLNDVELAISKL